MRRPHPLGLHTVAALIASCARPPRRAIPVDAEVTSVIVPADARAAGCSARERPPAGGTLHAAEVLGAERWRAEDSPHLLPFGLTVRRGASLTIEPCALMRIGAGRAITALTSAQFVARGTSLRPIVFERLDPAPWAGLVVERGVAAGTALAFVELVGGGAAGDERYAAALVVSAQGLAAQGVVTRGSAGWGLWLRDDGGFAAGASVEVRDSAMGAAVVDDADAVDRLPLSIPLRGSDLDAVLLSGARPTVRHESRWGGRGARYAVRDGVRIRVEGADAPRLTIVPGTTLIFGDDSALEVGVSQPGALSIDGGATRDVTLRGRDERPATWLGVTLGARIDVARSVFRGVTVRGAGAPTGAAVSGCGCPSDARGDAAMLALFAPRATAIVSNVLLHNGFARGVGVLRAAGSGASTEGLVASGRVDASTAGVACAEMGPLVEGRCRP